MKIDHVVDWLKALHESTKKELVPPFGVEIIMRDHRSYYLQDIILWDEESDSVVLRVWDLRALSEKDKEVVKLRLTKIRAEEIDGEGKNLHPDLDFGNLRINIRDIMYHIEWHDRYWPLGVEAIKMFKEAEDEAKRKE